jgi:hypothetical protein
MVEATVNRYEEAPMARRPTPTDKSPKKAKAEVPKDLAVHEERARAIKGGGNSNEDKETGGTLEFANSAEPRQPSQRLIS